MSANKAEIIAAVAAVAAAAIAFVTLDSSRDSERRQHEQERLQSASKVTLAEAPPYVNRTHPPRGNRIWWVVMNHSDGPIDDVWVEGRDGASVKMWQVQRCTMYAVPLDFAPVAVNFRNPQGRWRRAAGAVPVQPTGRKLPATDTADSPWTMQLDGCG